MYVTQGAPISNYFHWSELWGVLWSEDDVEMSEEESSSKEESSSESVPVPAKRAASVRDLIFSNKPSVNEKRVVQKKKRAKKAPPVKPGSRARKNKRA